VLEDGLDGGDDRVTHLLADLMFDMARETVTIDNLQVVITK
jgi:hypothetical protein